MASTIAACPAIEHAPRPSWIPPNEFSGFATRLATHYSSGAILVIGANQGPTGTDPSFEILGGEDAEHLHKIFVEPVPYLFKKLSHNIRNIARAKAVNVAVTNQSTKLSMYCFGLDAERGLGAHGQWPEALRKSSKNAEGA